MTQIHYDQPRHTETPQILLPDAYRKYRHVADLSFYATILPRHDSQIIERGGKDDGSYERFEFHPTAGIMRTYFFDEGEPKYAQVNYRTGDVWWTHGTLGAKEMQRLNRCFDQLAHADLKCASSMQTYQTLWEKIRSISSGSRLPEGNYLKYPELDRVLAVLSNRQIVAVHQLDIGQYYAVDTGYDTYILKSMGTNRVKDRDYLLAVPDKNLFGFDIINLSPGFGEPVRNLRPAHNIIPHAVELKAPRYGRMSIRHCSVADARLIASYTEPGLDLTFPQTEQDIETTTVVLALEALQFERWLDFDTNGPESQKHISQQKYAQALRVLFARFGSKVMTDACMELGMRHFSQLDAQPEHSRTRQMHADISPYGDIEMSVGREIIGENLIQSSDMSIYGHLVNVVPLFGDPLFWRSLDVLSSERDSAFQIQQIRTQLLQRLLQYRNPDISWLPQKGMYSDRNLEGNPLGILRDFFPHAFGAIASIDASVQEYVGPAFREKHKGTNMP